MSVKGDLCCSFPIRYYSFRVALDYLLFKILQIYLAVCYGAAFLLIHWLKQAILARFLFKPAFIRATALCLRRPY